MIIPVEQWEWYGQAGHFCAAARCLYHLHTHVGRFCISTIGEYRLNPNDEHFTPLGVSDHLYETMVFRTAKYKKEKMRTIVNHTELETKRTHTQEEAREAHMELCRKYAEK